MILAAFRGKVGSMQLSVAPRYFHQCNSSQRQTCHHPLQSLSVKTISSTHFLPQNCPISTISYSSTSICQKLCHQHIYLPQLYHNFHPPFINCLFINFSTKQDQTAITLAKGLPTMNQNSWESYSFPNTKISPRK